MMRVDPVERHLFLEGIFMRYGYDFRQYAQASLDRRLTALMARYGATNLLEILQKLLASAPLFRDALPYLTINTTEFFRDPSFFRALRERVFPRLSTYPKINIWIAGCSTGEEVLSLAILLREAGLLKRARLHATDINPNVLKTAKTGIYELSTMQSYNKKYVLSGGDRSPSDYYSTEYGLARFDLSLLENVVFSEHNLVTDSPFIEAQLVLCRNTLIYFNREIQDRAFDLFARSLAYKGFLGIGSKESVRFSSSSALFGNVDEKENIYYLRELPRATFLEDGGV